ncbi:hypothetical protein DFH08DRAFT_930997 [Mycena albidolilacea]|uniref:Uncharacterized protein n=1 Tax=Mycena albidolilacea TaxID=1033008 RepID=A0AAD7AN80_9AGAR|nr:hypothetical protein DFH08DRAFT_930997 [Mycena albidolilacea]
MTKGDASRLRAGATDWWKGPDAKRKRADRDSSPITATSTSTSVSQASGSSAMLWAGGDFKNSKPEQKTDQGNAPPLRVGIASRTSAQWKTYAEGIKFPLFKGREKESSPTDRRAMKRRGTWNLMNANRMREKYLGQANARELKGLLDRRRRPNDEWSSRYIGSPVRRHTTRTTKRRRTARVKPEVSGGRRPEATSATVVRTGTARRRIVGWRRTLLNVEYVDRGGQTVGRQAPALQAEGSNGCSVVGLREQYAAERRSVEDGSARSLDGEEMSDQRRTVPSKARNKGTDETQNMKWNGKRADGRGIREAGTHGGWSVKAAGSRGEEWVGGRYNHGGDGKEAVRKGLQLGIDVPASRRKNVMDRIQNAIRDRWRRGVDDGHCCAARGGGRKAELNGMGGRKESAIAKKVTGATRTKEGRDFISSDGRKATSAGSASKAEWNGAVKLSRCQRGTYATPSIKSRTRKEGHNPAAEEPTFSVKIPARENEPDRGRSRNRGILRPNEGERATMLILVKQVLYNDKPRRFSQICKVEQLRHEHVAKIRKRSYDFGIPTSCPLSHHLVALFPSSLRLCAPSSNSGHLPCPPSLRSLVNVKQVNLSTYPPVHRCCGRHGSVSLVSALCAMTSMIRPRVPGKMGIEPDDALSPPTYVALPPTSWTDGRLCDWMALGGRDTTARRSDAGDVVHVLGMCGSSCKLTDL